MTTSNDLDLDALRQYLGFDRNKRIAELRKQREFIDNELADLERIEDAYRAAMDYENAAVEALRFQWGVSALSPSDVRGLQNTSKREALEKLARWNRDWLVVDKAIRFLIAIEVFTEESNASAQVYTLLRDPRWVRVGAGLYRLAPGAIAAPEPTSEVVGKSGLVDRVQAIRNEHPDWERNQVRDLLIREGWDFGDKNPTYSVGIAFANLAKREKAKQEKAQKPISMVS